MHVYSIKQILLWLINFMFCFLGVAIMPTGQQIYSPTGFLPVPMSSPSGYAAGCYPFSEISAWNWGPSVYTN